MVFSLLDPSSPRLPRELVDLIIDYLHDDGDRDTLLTCVQVARIFRARSQKHLFSTITITYRLRAQEHNYESARPLVNILTQNPGLAKHIRHLSLMEYAEGYWVYPDPEDIPYHIFHQEPDETLPLLFDTLVSLTSFTLVGLGKLVEGCFHHSGRGMLSPALVSSLINMFTKTKVPEIKLSQVSGIPLSHIAANCPDVKRLSLCGTRCSCVTGEDPPVDGVYPPLDLEPLAELDMQRRDLGRLEWLELTEHSLSCKHYLYDHTIPGAPSRLSLTHLRELKITGNAPDMVALASQMIIDTAKTLEKFTWEVVHTLFTDFDVSPFTALKRATNLRSVCLAFRRRDWEFCWLAPTLEFLSSNPTLEELIIVYSEYAPYVSMKEIREWSSSLDSHLANPIIFPVLRSVLVIEIVSPDSKWPYKVKALAGMFPKLMERGMIITKPAVWSYSFPPVEAYIQRVRRDIDSDRRWARRNGRA